MGISVHTAETETATTPYYVAAHRLLTVERPYTIQLYAGLTETVYSEIEQQHCYPLLRLG